MNWDDDQRAAADSAEETARNTLDIAKDVSGLPGSLEQIDRRLFDLELALGRIERHIDVIHSGVNNISFVSLAAAAVYVWDRWLAHLFTK